MFQVVNWIKSLFPVMLGGRSGKWSSVRKEWLRLNPTCAVCGYKAKLLKPLEVHHCVPFNIDPNKELDFTNLITLCRPHHILFGHLMNFKSWNLEVREDAKKFLDKIINRPI